MITALLIINLVVTLALIGLILLQRSEGGGLGMGGGGGGLMTGRGAANLLTHATTVLATLFMCLCLALAMLNRGAVNQQKDILSVPPAAQENPSHSKSS